MAGGKDTFWGRINNYVVVFALCVFVLIMAALLVDSLVYGYPDVSEQQVEDNTAPVGRVFYRS